jgi:hypothetical protein
VAGHHDHRARRERAGLGPFAQQADAVGARHPDIEQGDIWMIAQPNGPRLDRVGGDKHGISFVLQDFLDGIADVRLVVDYQDRCAGHSDTVA